MVIAISSAALPVAVTLYPCTCVMYGAIHRLRVAMTTE